MVELNGETRHSLSSLLCTEERDYLIRKNGEKVKVGELEGKYVGLYFEPIFYWCSWRFSTRKLSEIYEKLLEKGDLEIVYVSEEFDDTCFEDHLHKMPWLAVPYSDENTRENLRKAFRKGRDEPCFTVLDKDGRVINPDGVGMIKKYGAEAYPFTAERLEELDAANTVESLLVSDERDYVLGHGGRKVPVRELVGKTVALHFDDSNSASYSKYRNFNAKLVEIYNELREKGETFEIVFMPLDLEKYENEFIKYYANFPWLTLPLGDKTALELLDFFDIEYPPALIILHPYGGTLEINAIELINKYGIRAYPFTKERLDELEEEKKAKRESQTLESLLVSDERNFVIKHGGAQVLVSELVGKTVALYFSAHRCCPCRRFTPELVKVYNELKERGESFEIVFLSRDDDQETFEDHYKNMPWLALPFGDKTKEDIGNLFDVEFIPALLVVHPDGKIVTNTKDTVTAIRNYGAKAYPFTDAHLQTLGKEIEEHEKSDDANDEGHSDDVGHEKADTPSEKGHEEDADAAIDENNKPAGVICEGGVCYSPRR